MRIRLEHQSLLDGRYHVITSPDVPGLYVTGESRNEAMQELVQVLPRIQAIRDGSPEEAPIAIEYARVSG